MTAGPLREPWLVAAWPGMGAVALGAANWLRRALGAVVEAEIPPGDHFDVTHVTIDAGVITSGGIPTNTIYGWANPDPAGHDLLVFVGGAQPGVRGYAFCLEVMDRAIQLGARRVVTFAAMATPRPPSAPARVFGAATAAHLLGELESHDVELLKDGEITGLNGVLLAAAEERGLDGMCLLGELPYFASTIANPKSSAAVLRVFSSLAGIEIDLTGLDAEGAEVERQLTQLLERLQQGSGPAEFLGTAGEPLAEPPQRPDEGSEGLKPADRARLEHLFDEARRDRSKALRLKRELDRLGVFKEYEDRFLDLFKQGG